MNKYIGICKEVGDKWYSISFLLYKNMLKIYLYSPKYKRPKYIWYTAEQFEYSLSNEIIRFKWFIGIGFVYQQKKKRK